MHDGCWYRMGTACDLVTRGDGGGGDEAAAAVARRPSSLGGSK